MLQAGGSTLTLTVPVSWGMLSSYTSPKVGQGASLYRFTGQLVAQATLGCPTDCGPHGRCAAGADGTAACACECGWGGPACDVPSGFCSSFPAELAGAAACPVAPAPAPPPADQPCVPASGGVPLLPRVCSCVLLARCDHGMLSRNHHTCPHLFAECTSTQQFNASTGSCACQAGWGGPGGCRACQTAAACDAYFGASGATCSNEVAFQQGMQFKAYTCDLAVRAFCILHTAGCAQQL